MGCLLFLSLSRVHRIREPVHAERNVLPRRRQAITPPTSWLDRIFIYRQVQTSYPYGLANHRQRRSYSIIRTLRWRVRPASSHIFSQLTPLANNYFNYPSILSYSSIQGTSWISTDPAESQDLYTLFSLYRTHSYLTTNRAQKSFTTSSGLKIIGADTTGGEHVTPPVRLLFPRVPTFSSPGLPPVDGNPKTHPPARVKAYNGEWVLSLLPFFSDL